MVGQTPARMSARNRAGAPGSSGPEAGAETPATAAPRLSRGPSRRRCVIPAAVGRRQPCPEDGSRRGRPSMSADMSARATNARRSDGRAGAGVPTRPQPAGEAGAGAPARQQPAGDISVSKTEAAAAGTGTTWTGANGTPGPAARRRQMPASR